VGGGEEGRRLKGFGGVGEVGEGVYGVILHERFYRGLGMVRWTIGMKV